MVEVIWTVITTKININLIMAILLHDAIHRFRQVRGVGMETVEEKLAKQVAGIYHEIWLRCSWTQRKLKNTWIEEGA